jgi:transposase
MKKITLQCANPSCEEEFEVSEKQQKYRPRQFCSRKCFYEARRVPREQRFCEECGSKFQTKVTSSQRFCSKGCANKYTARLNSEYPTRAAPHVEDDIDIAMLPEIPQEAMHNEYEGVTSAQLDPFGSKERQESYYLLYQKIEFKLD